MIKRILAIDGGGMKGYIPAAVLVEIEKRTGKPCCELFDLIAGTSIGGIVGTLLAMGMPASDVLTFFTVDGPNIFGREVFGGEGGAFRPRYDPAILEKCLQTKLGTATLADCKTELFVPALDMAAYAPVLFASSKTSTYPLWKPTRATSAAQSYFPAFVDGTSVYWDGGGVANNPAAIALAKAVMLWGRDTDIRILSLGCGATVSKLPVSKLISPTIMEVAEETLNVGLDMNDELPDFILSALLPTGSYLRVQMPYNSALSIDGADPAALQALEAAGQACITQFSTKLDAFIASSLST